MKPFINSSKAEKWSFKFNHPFHLIKYIDFMERMIYPPEKNNQMRTILLFFLTSAVNLLAQNNNGTTSIFEKICTEARVTGAVLVKLDSNEMKTPQVFGIRNAVTKEKITATTIFEAASLSKPVFAQLIFKLAENKVIDLNKPLVEYLPLKAISDNRFSKVTATHVLTHTTGLPNWIKKRKDAQLKFEPGSEFRYSGEAYRYLQRVVESLTNKSIDELMSEYIFQPYDMPNSSFSFNDTSLNCAIPHNSKEEPQIKKLTGRFASAASSLHTTIEDYAKFLLMVKEDTSFFSTTIEVDQKFHISWGMGVGIETQDADTIIWHWGNNWNTFKSFFAYSMEKQTGYVILTNSENGHSIMDEINKLILNTELQFPDWLGYKQRNITGK